jgi:hypothetical protein
MKKSSKDKTPHAKHHDARSAEPARKSRSTNDGFSGRGKVRNNAGGHIDSRKSVASKIA